jgi:hypothetical protein
MSETLFPSNVLSGCSLLQAQANGNGNGSGKNGRSKDDAEFLAIAGRSARTNGANAYFGLTPQQLDAGITE